MKQAAIEITKRCNFDCFYCHYRESNGFDGELQKAEILKRCEDAVQNGIDHLELTGGEPLLYENLEDLIVRIKEIPGVEQVSMTTNGSLLDQKIDALIAAGLDAVNLHMDVCDAMTFASITGKEKILNPILGAVWTAAARDLLLTISVVVHEESKPYLAVMAGLAKKFNITIRYVIYGQWSRDCNLDEVEVVRILSRHIKGLEQTGNHTYRSDELKGKIVFGTTICEAEQSSAAYAALREEYPLPEEMDSAGNVVDRETGHVLSVGIVTHRELYWKTGYVCDADAPEALHACVCSMLKQIQQMPVIKTVLLTPEMVYAPICGEKEPTQEILHYSQMALCALQKTLEGYLKTRNHV